MATTYLTCGACWGEGVVSFMDPSGQEHAERCPDCQGVGLYRVEDGAEPVLHRGDAECAAAGCHDTQVVWHSTPGTAEVTPWCEQHAPGEVTC